MKIIDRGKNQFPIAEMTQSEYGELPDYSVAIPIEISVGSIWKIPRLQQPGELLVVKKVNESIAQMMQGVIVDTDDKSEST